MTDKTTVKCNCENDYCNCSTRKQTFILGAKAHRWEHSLRRALEEAEDEPGMTTNRNSFGLMSYNGTICIPDPLLVDTFHHQDGSTSYVLYDQDCESPRVTAFPDPLTVLTQTNSRYRKVDDAPELREALNRLPEPVAFRYMKAFHDVAAITAWHDHSGRYGHIYLTRAALLAARPRIAFASVNGADAEAVMRAELSEYQAWADGEVYGCINVDANGGEESCWGLIGYDSLEEVVAQVCESPILGTK